MDDKQLVNRFLKSRSERAFVDLYRAKTPKLYPMALRLCSHDQQHAEDLIQEMWCIAIGKLAEFQWRSELKTWLTGILINLSREKRKQEEKEMNLHRTLATEVERPLEPSVFDVHDLEKAIGELPPGYRQVIVLHDVEGYTHQEIAELLDIAEGTSKSQLYHARKTLREYLSQ